ncbi:MAG: hypothetical protein AAFX85_10125 [Pseudomonadota bacterium]
MPETALATISALVVIVAGFNYCRHAYRIQLKVNTSLTDRQLYYWAVDMALWLAAATYVLFTLSAFVLSLYAALYFDISFGPADWAPQASWYHNALLWARWAVVHNYGWIAAGTYFVGAALTWVSNKTTDHAKVYRSEAQWNQLLLRLLWSIDTDTPLLFTLRNDQAYVGIPSALPITRGDLRWVTVVAFLSGVRDPKTRRFEIRINYADLLEELKEAQDFEATWLATCPKLLEHCLEVSSYAPIYDALTATLSIDEIVSIHPYDGEMRDYLNAQYGSAAFEDRLLAGESAVPDDEE